VFGKILIANRGEIAMRVIRACRTLGIKTVAIHSDVDAGALHVRFADEAVCIGPADPRRSYLNIPQIIAAAEISGADAVHPGYGFLSENADFAELCRRCKLTFIGPTPDAMRLWGDKVRAREAAKKFGLPLLPGTGVLRDGADAATQAEVIGYPIILKAAGGGGGRGMRIVREASEIRRSFEHATSEALAGFKNPDVYLEKFIEEPRHIELQILGDARGHVFALGERECSLQRRHQKVMEEAPSPIMTAERRGELGDMCRRALEETGYTSLGTLEFLMDERGNFYFMEMNPRVQVEHPVTEMVTGIDLVENQIRAAAGQSLDLPEGRSLGLRGHALECRINAEDPRTFVPWPGAITEYHPPGGGGVRVDSGVYGGWRVPNAYDPLLAKVITHGATRAEAIARMRCALDEFIIGGIRTNIPLHQALLRDPDVLAGRMSTRTIERLVARL
jgi:acetyl-CoA carboxylase, biotin carboxylase subunit